MSPENFRNTAPSIARVLFIGFGALYLSLGLAIGVRGALMSWLGLSLLLLGLAYALQRPWLIGKRSDGSFHPLAVVIHAPILAVCWIAWRARRRRSEPAWNEVAPGLFVGRMVRLAELPPGGPLVVDLTCELVPPARLRGSRYRCLPTLDGCAPEPKAFRALVDEIAQLEGPVFIHCAAGHGRSATLAAAVMIRRGYATDVTAAEELMKSKRPRVGLGKSQLSLVTDGLFGPGAS